MNTQVMNIEMYINKCYDIKREDNNDDEEISIGSQDTYSQRSLTTQPDEYQEDSFLMIDTENSELDGY